MFHFISHGIEIREFYLQVILVFRCGCTVACVCTCLCYAGSGGVEWTSLHLTPWWASVLPALARHQQLQATNTTTNSSLHHHHHHSSRNALNSLPPSFLHPPQLHPHSAGSPPPPPPPSSALLTKLKNETNRNAWPGLAKIKNERGSGLWSRENSSSSPGAGWTPGNRGSPSGPQQQPPPPVVSLAGLDQLSLVTALGKEVSPQMVQALQAVATRRESFSSAAKLYSVSVTTLWRYFKKLNLSDAQKNANAAAVAAATAAAAAAAASAAATSALSTTTGATTIVASPTGTPPATTTTFLP